jgi:AbrB family looped-hinge helix DNA binding protein
MNARTTMSAKGQVVIPKHVRDRLGFRVGEQLDVIETAGGILLKKHSHKSGESFEEITARIRARVNYNGPPVSIEEMNESIEQMAIASALRSDCVGD